MSDAKSKRLFVPGRLCLFGEHSDWAAERGLYKGYCLVIGTDQGLTAVVSADDNFFVSAQHTDDLGHHTGTTREMRCDWQSDKLLAVARDKNEFFRYCAGVAYEIRCRYGIKSGMSLRITAMDLPLRKGVSSSAAVCILVAKAFDALYGLGLFPHELMDLAYLGERLTGSECGRMDQACIFGKTPVLLTLQRSAEVRVEPAFPAGTISMFFVDLGGKKDTVRILTDLREAYLSSPTLQEALGPDNERIVRGAYRALSAGNAEVLGQLMTEAQKIFDRKVAPHSPEELASPLLHQLLGWELIAEHIHGGKGVGSQGDGTAQFVARSATDRDAAMEKIHRAWPQMCCFRLTILRGTAHPSTDH